MNTRGRPLPGGKNSMVEAARLIELLPENMRQDFKLVPVVKECDACTHRAYIRGDLDDSYGKVDLCCGCFSNMVIDALPKTQET